MKQFDHQRKEFTPYGFTCEQWVPKMMPKADRHNEIELNLLGEGSLTYLIRGESVTIPAGRLAVFWATIPHQIVAFDRSTPYTVATIPLSWVLQWSLPEALIQPLLNGEIIIESDSRRAVRDQETFGQWTEDVQQASPDRLGIVQLEMEARLRRLAMSLVAAQHEVTQEQSQHHVSRRTGDMGKAEQMACFVAQHYAEPLRVRDIADKVELHPDYAASLFQKTFGTTLNRYLTQYRISHAKRLLVTTDARILNVAMESGFNSLSRFNAAFKSFCACTPRQYRQNHQFVVDD